ncbi:MAG: type II toxin-antitoxin system RelE/ParE family toxin [Gammaproteobacteria bacterium]|nr:type II toxin-antitoxin system RelE/ParE family toxin [Gammaproteobacteria bacterium]
MRSSVSDKRIVRIFFCSHEGKMVLLHGFIKKTRKAPETDLDLAVTRMKEVKKHD